MSDREEVEVDYTSLNGGEPQRSTPEEIVDGRRTNLTGTHVADEATGDRLCTVGGRYDVRAQRVGGRWRIAALTLTVRWATRNQAIMGGL